MFFFANWAPWLGFAMFLVVAFSKTVTAFYFSETILCCMSELSAIFAYWSSACFGKMPPFVTFLTSPTTGRIMTKSVTIFTLRGIAVFFFVPLLTTPSTWRLLTFAYYVSFFFTIITYWDLSRNFFNPIWTCFCRGGKKIFLLQVYHSSFVS